MVADVVEMILVDHVRDFVKLNAGFLRVNPCLPTDVDDDDALVCGVDNEYDGQRNVARRTEQNGDWLKSGINSINQTNEL